MRKSWLLFLSVSAAFLILLYVATLLILRVPAVQAAVIKKIEQGFQGDLELRELQVTPGLPISLIARDVSYLGPEPRFSEPIFQTPEVKVRLSPFHLLFGRVVVSRLRARQGAFHWEFAAVRPKPLSQITMKGVDIEVRNLLAKEPIEFFLRKGILANGEISKIRGQIRLADADGTAPKGFSKIHLEVAELPLQSFLEQIGLELAGVLPEGRLDWETDLSWDREGKYLTVKGEGAVREFAYSLSQDPSLKSPQIDWNFEHEVRWNDPLKALEVNQARIASEIGSYVLRGKVGENQRGLPIDLELRSEKFNLDGLAKFLEPIQIGIPNKLGFSGESEMTLMIRGAANNFSLAGTFELESSLLTYGGFFSKARGIPMTFQMKLQVAQGQNVRGDLSCSLKELTLKGSVVDLDLRGGTGTLTFLTNSFSLDGWSSILLPFKQFEPKGNLKVLANLEGNLFRGEELQVTTTLTLSGVDSRFGGSLSIDDLDAVVEWSNTRLSSGTAALNLGGSPVQIQFTKGPGQEGPWSFTVSSPALDVRTLSTELRNISPESVPSGFPEKIIPLETSIHKALAQGEGFSNLACSGTWSHNSLSLQELRFFLGEGSLSAAGEFGLASPNAPYNLRVEIRDLELYPLLARLTEQDLIRGKFSLSGSFSGRGTSEEELEKFLKGQGQFRLSEGRFNTVDLLAAMSGIPQLGVISGGSGKGTEIEDLNANFVVDKGRVFTDNLTLVSPRLSADAKGSFSFRGDLDYDVTLGLRRPASAAGLSEELGLAIPARLEGPIEDPRFRISKSLVGNLLSGVLEKPVGRLLGREPKGAASPTTSGEEPESEPDLLESGIQALSGLLKKKGASS